MSRSSSFSEMESQRGVFSEESQCSSAKFNSLDSDSKHQNLSDRNAMHEQGVAAHSIDSRQHKDHAEESKVIQSKSNSTSKDLPNIDRASRTVATQTEGCANVLNMDALRQTVDGVIVE